MAKVVPVVIEAFRTITRELDGWIEKLGMTCNVRAMQKTTLLGTGYWGKRWKCKEEIVLLAVYDPPNRRNDDNGNIQNMMLNNYDSNNK